MALGGTAAIVAALQARFPGVRPVAFGHLGAGNLHYNVQVPEGEDGKKTPGRRGVRQGHGRARYRAAARCTPCDAGPASGA